MLRRALKAAHTTARQVLQSETAQQPLATLSEIRYTPSGYCASLHSTPHLWHGGGGAAPGADTISVTYKDEKDRSEKTVQVPVGQNLLEAAHAHDVDLEGACECSLACSTCHVIVEDQDYYDRLPEPCDDENDMLDLAFGLTDTSRLGCQVIAEKDIDGIRVRIPSATRNFAVDGFVPKPH